ncbi:opine metallophore biosynthesis dehydrogenase [Burkholderia sp. BCC1972]|uniref:opine metallophore biosynthesis dehydrogenase n=1 Tax=Burkholderia sp. BCC1972 TaxID=2817438 RepID=UPI002ABE6BDE|nr:opine metallophore biosynthesis dehydrogenase [Burkholderia sp. BCC1972]
MRDHCNTAEDFLFIGLGAVAIQFAFDLRSVSDGMLGFMSRPGARSRLIRDAIAAGQPLSLEGRGRALSEPVSMPIDSFHEGGNCLDDRWDTLILCTPADCYVDVLKGLPWDRLTRVRSIVLMSPFLGAALLVEAALPANRQFNVICLSSYFGDTKILDATQPLAATTKAFKRRIFIAANRECATLHTVRRAVERHGIEVVIMRSPLEAEARSITTYVHSPLVLCPPALEHVLFSNGPDRYIYKLHPEGPITPQVMRSMVRLWKEISTLLERMGAQPVNLLKFLNDDNYPVDDVMLERDAIAHFPDFDELHQEYLLFVRYSALLVDPFSQPDERGRYFDFSAVPFRRAHLDADGLWQIPRVPLEDHRKLSLIRCLGQCFDLPMPHACELLSNYETAIQRFISEKGVANCHPTILQESTQAQAATIYRQWSTTFGKAESC